MTGSLRRALWLTVLCMPMLATGVSAQLLYRITGKGLSEPSYIFATHHAVPVSVLGDVEGLFKAYNDCRAVVGEIAMDEDSVSLRMAVEAKMQTPIEDLLKADDYRVVDSALMAAVGIRLADVSLLRPAMIENIYLLSVYEKMFGAEKDDTAMDSFFQQVALQQGKPVYGLESIDDQLKILFHTKSIQQQAKELVNSVKHSGALRDDIEHLNCLYLTAQLDSIAEWSFLSGDFTPDDYRVLVSDRNRAWVDRIEELMQSGSCFIAVGALHLPMEDGLLELLGKRGYRVKAVDRRGAK